MRFLNKIFNRKTSKDIKEISQNKSKEPVLFYDENKIPPSERNIVIPYYTSSREIIKNYHIKKQYPYGWEFEYQEKYRDRYFDENPSKCGGINKYGVIINDELHFYNWVRIEDDRLEYEKNKKINNYLKSEELEIELNKSEEIFQIEEEQSYKLGKKLYKNEFHKSVNGSLILEIDKNICSLNKKFKPIKSKILSEEEQLINIYKKIIWFGYYDWFWNKCFSEEGYELSEYDWSQYCLQRYGTTKDTDGDDLCPSDSGLIEYLDEQRKRYKYPKSVISDKNYFDYYFTYNPFYENEPYHRITGEYNFLNKEFDVIRYWTHDYLIKLRKKQKTNIEWNLNIEKTMKLINNKLFDTDKKLPSNIWNISRSYDFGRTFFLMKDYIFHKKHPSDIYTLFDCIVKWENGTLLNENDGGYQNQKPLWVRWGEIIPHFRTMGRYLIKNEGGLEWLKNDVGDYLIKRQKYYNELVGENHELSISDEHIKMITENLDVFSVKWKSEYELYELLKDLLSKYNTEVVFHYYPKYLKGQELDLFFKYKRKKIGIEYQGKQHFEPIDFFGGEESFNKTKERDERKKDLCEKNNVHLIYYNYDEEISESVLRQKIEKVIRLND